MTTKPRILVLDIERVPMFTKPLPVWSMGDLKGKWLSPSEIGSWGRTICLAYRWQGEKQIGFIAEWQDGGREVFLQQAWELYDEADVVVGHNIISFDTPHLQGEWLLEDMNLPSPVRQIDTLKLARKSANWEANHLDTLDKRFGYRGKSDKYRIQLAMDAVNGDEKAQGKLRRYNEGDIRSTERVYNRLRPLSRVNVGLFIDDDEPRCPACGGAKLQRRGYAVTGVSVFPRYRCMSCGKWMRGKKSERIVELRPE